jgi:hypothetical protein
MVEDASDDEDLNKDMTGIKYILDDDYINSSKTCQVCKEKYESNIQGRGFKKLLSA